ncbi:MAG TPA: biotin--[acetyl-CoA-carboxylase] ligase [Pyrinomonadaceae bacterium]|nr:biotin--[acetyl-CoA-carboxylase] ligase [Pyrinomonadaceae bacterium]
MNINLLTFDTIDSTNTEAVKQARLGADEGLCVVARQQTAGRGRHGRTWVSEKDAGLYFSIVLRPKFDAKYLPLITLTTGVAVHDTLEELGIKSDIKWVNDLLVNEKKICGILAETTDTNDGIAVIVGIGINLKSTNFPPEIADIATSIQESLPSALAGGDLISALTKYLSYFYGILTSESGPAEIIDEWRRRSTYFSGKQVRVVSGNETVSGVTDGLEENGALRLRKANGNVTIIQAGDVEKVRAAH